MGTNYPSADGSMRAYFGATDGSAVALQFQRLTDNNTSDIRLTGSPSGSAYWQWFNAGVAAGFKIGNPDSQEGTAAVFDKGLYFGNNFGAARTMWMTGQRRDQGLIPSSTPGRLGDIWWNTFDRNPDGWRCVAEQPSAQWRQFNLAGGSLGQTGSGAITIDPTQGDDQTLTASGNITSITINNGFESQVLSIKAVQGASGTTWPTTIGNAKLPGGTLAAKTPGASSVDLWTFRFMGSSWWLLSSGANLS